MTKSELCIEVAKRNPFLTHKDAEIIVDVLFDSMVASLLRKERIEFRGFGNFSVKQMKARKGRNPKTGEVVHVPETARVVFKIGKELFERLNKKPPSQ